VLFPKTAVNTKSTPTNASIVALAQKAAPSEQSKADKHKKKEPPGFFRGFFLEKTRRNLKNPPFFDKIRKNVKIVK
jgi:hypothetical protein